jgi:uncharacterized circularly permuted ATP-grasp superfamily protein/uncharacterized alpha-E superfamily protein
MSEPVSLEVVKSIQEVTCIRSLLPSYHLSDGRHDLFNVHDPATVSTLLRLLTKEEHYKQLQVDPKLLSCLEDHIIQRWRSVKIWLQEHGASLTSHTDETGKPSWELDPLPLVMSEKNWLPLSAAIAQRARLIDAITRDIYGPQRLMADGTIPLELVYGSGQFLPSMQTTIRAGERAIYLYAAQLCQDSTGKWYTIADRTQGPSGCGHALENRIAMSRVLSEEFRDFYVQRSATFFATLRDTIAAYASMRSPNARTILLSPGIRSRTYFEDAYLARYLGYTLAQSEDLTVRSGKVFQKTLSGLIQVQAILRRVQDEQCDPLELASNMGVPGLCQSVREGNVALINPIGCGWAEMPVVASQLAKWCPRVLGEELLLPTVPMHWCGDAESRNYVLSNIDRLEIRDAAKREEYARVYKPGRAKIENERLAYELNKHGWKYIAVEPREHSTAAVWNNDRLEPWPMVMRVFATLNEERYTVLPGGVGRLAPKDSMLNESLACGILSKDVWVVGTKPPNPLTLRKPPQRSLELRRSAFDLASRVAESLYWLGRFTQRAESMIRHARAVASRLIEDSDLHLAQAYAVIYDALDRSESKAWDETATTSPKVMKIVRQKLLATLFDPDDGGSLRSVMRSIENNVAMVRDRLSVDSGQLLLELTSFQSASRIRGPDDLGETLVELNGMLRLLSSFSGMVAENMTRGPGWLFLDLGIRIERLQQQTHILRTLLIHDYAWMTPLLEALLEIMDSIMTYRFRYLMQVEIDPTVDLLLVDESNPRAIAFQLNRIDELLKLLDEQTKLDGIAEKRRDIDEIFLSMRLIDADSMCALFKDAENLRLPMISEDSASIASLRIKAKEQASLHKFAPEMLLSKDKRYALGLLTDRIEYSIAELHNFVSDRFFVHTAHVQRLGN